MTVRPRPGKDRDDVTIKPCALSCQSLRSAESQSIVFVKVVTVMRDLKPQDVIRRRPTVAESCRFDGKSLSLRVRS
jgi:hypothetical protein